MDFESTLLLWIGHFAGQIETEAGHQAPVHVRQLLIQMANDGQKGGIDLTESVMTSLHDYDRATLARALRRLQKEGMVLLVDESMVALDPMESHTKLRALASGSYRDTEQEEVPEYVSLTDQGLTLFQSLMKKHIESQRGRR